MAAAQRCSRSLPALGLLLLLALPPCPHGQATDPVTGEEPEKRPPAAAAAARATAAAAAAASALRAGRRLANYR